ncbi:MAG: signal peptidase I [Bacteroidia bacterium]|nr:MAG: signal peptidase I [Bacteroidia bacterium]
MQQAKEIFKNKWFLFTSVTVIYLLWILWIGNFWLLIGIPVIFDIYISKKVHWEFWKKRNLKKKSKLMEWIDALIFAVIAATLIRLFFIEAYTIPTSSMEKSLLVGDYLFVSKVSYGPRMPNTPLSFPFAHHTLPLTSNTKSYLEWIKWDYKRLVGFGEVERNDVVVFNYPEGDTLSTLYQSNQSYYALTRQFGRKRVWEDKRSFGDIITRPVDKRENYVKRCVAIHGDTLQIKHGQAFINGKPQEKVGDFQYKYDIVTQDRALNSYFFSNLGISREDYEQAMIANFTYRLPLTQENVEKLKANQIIKSITRVEIPEGVRMPYIFPHNPNYKWNEDNFGPLYIPAKGATIALTPENLPLYRRAIEVYEKHKVEQKNGKIFIDGKETNKYTFAMDYYFMMGDSRHNSADSRFWGFVPEDHVVGKAVFIWFSTDKDKSFLKKIRWNRIFNLIK